MEKKTRNSLIAAGTLFLLFVLLVILVLTVNVAPVGPLNSSIGLSAVNKSVFDFLGVNMVWYSLTDWIGVAAIAAAVGFAVLGLVQLVKRKSLKRVDLSILSLGIVYLLTAASYLFFEFVVVNYRPVILGESLAASFPSSTTLTVIVILGTAIPQCVRLFRSRKILKIVTVTVCAAALAVAVVGRQLSGVHWFTDILGAILLGTALVFLYNALARRQK